MFNGDKIDKAQLQEESEFSFAVMRKRFLENQQSSSVSLQGLEIQQEMEALRGRDLSYDEDTAPLKTHKPINPSEEFTGVNVKEIGSQFSTPFSFMASQPIKAQSKENSKFKENQGIVEEKQDLANPFYESLKKDMQKIMEAVKRNDTSADAEAIKESKPEEFEAFISHQQLMIESIKQKMELDFKAFDEEQLTLRGLDRTRFLTSSFLYRTYETCLQLNLQFCLSLCLQRADEETKVDMYCMFPLRSINYRQDFFNNLADIETLWEGTGKHIRQLEMFSYYLMHRLTTFDKEILTNILNQSDIKKAFEDQFGELVNAIAPLQDYIQNRDNVALPDFDKSRRYNACLNFEAILSENKAQEETFQLTI